MNARSGKVLRTVAIILMGLTAAMNILGGAGTSCAAFFTKKYPPMWSLFQYRWLYQALVLTTVPLGIANVWATVGLVRGKKNAYRNTLLLLIIGTVLGGIHMGASLILRGAAIPANVKFYINLATLLVVLLFRLPAIRTHVDLETAGGTDKTTAGGLAAIVAGCAILTVARWAGPSHTYLGLNWVQLIQLPLNLVGAGATLVGLAQLVRVAWSLSRPESKEQIQLSPEGDRALV